MSVYSSTDTARQSNNTSSGTQNNVTINYTANNTININYPQSTYDPDQHYNTLKGLLNTNGSNSPRSLRTGTRKAGIPSSQSSDIPNAPEGQPDLVKILRQQVARIYTRCDELAGIVNPAAKFPWAHQAPVKSSSKSHREDVSELYGVLVLKTSELRYCLNLLDDCLEDLQRTMQKGSFWGRGWQPPLADFLTYLGRYDRKLAQYRDDICRDLPRGMSMEKIVGSLDDTLRRLRSNVAEIFSIVTLCTKPYPFLRSSKYNDKLSRYLQSIFLRTLEESKRKTEGSTDYLDRLLAITVVESGREIEGKIGSVDSSCSYRSKLEQPEEM